MSKTISNTISSNFVLTAAYDPLSITGAGAVIAGNGSAIYGSASQPWQISNSGLVDGQQGSGIQLLSGSSVTNAGEIEAGAASDGVSLQDGGTVNNTGRRALIEGGRYGIRVAGAAATIANSGSILGTSGLDGGGVGLYAGGTVTNSGAINGAGDFGVYITGGAGTVTNAGSIGGASGAVYLKGSYADRVIFDPGAVFRGRVTGGSGSNTLELAAGATGTLSGFGSSFTNFGTVAIDSGAKWQFDATDTISLKGTLTIDQGTLGNAGVIDTEVTVAGGGSLANTGTINGLAAGIFSVYAVLFGVYASGGTETVTNSGTIKGFLDGVDLSAGGDVFNGGPSTAYIYSRLQEAINIDNGVGTVTNAGTIVGFDAGVLLGAGGSVGNTGIIEGNNEAAGNGVQINGTGTVTNSGEIKSYYPAVYLPDGGTVVNTGYIYASNSYSRGDTNGFPGDGILLGGAGTVVNAGTIVGKDKAIQFVGNDGNRLIVDPGAVFTGLVQGGPGSNTLELAAGTTGATGTLSGFGTSFTNFGTILVDPGAKWQFDSSGTIASGVSLTDSGVFLGNAGVIDTPVTLTATGTFANTGSVNPGSSAKYAVTLQAGGVVSNAGTIVAAFPNKGQAVRIDGGAGSLGNTGTILGDGDGVVLTDGGTVTNSGSIRGTNGIGVYIGGGAGTVTNAGTIGGGNEAVYFSGDFADRMILDPGAVLQGTVHGGSGTNTLELAAGSSGATGTLSAFGSEFTGFGTIALDSGAAWELDGAPPASRQSVTLGGTGDRLALGTPGSFADPIGGFGPTDTLDLTGLHFHPGATATLSGDALTVSSGGTIDTFTLAGVPSGTTFRARDDGTPAHGTLVDELLCFLRGTRIRTPGGEVAVEDLRIGDPVCLHDGGVAPIRWIGQGSALVTAGKRSPATPVIVRRGALGPGVPHTDLHVTKGHALHLGGALIPAEFLVNHRSIVWDDRAREVEVFHIEVPEHQVILANGAPAETYRDEANRWMFRNARPAWDRPGIAPYAPVLTGGPVVDAVWADLLARGGQRNPVPTTDDPDLHLLVDGGRLDGRALPDGRCVFRLPYAPQEIVVASRAGRQDELGRHRDPRLLGVALSQMVLWDSPVPVVIGADHPDLRRGFHAYEPDGGIIWTNGRAVLPEVCRPRRAGHLHLYVKHTTHYPQPAAARKAA